MEVLLTALTLGLLGSLHCIGMCGPIALALPVVSNSSYARYKGIALYNMGRVFTYSMLGLIFGLLGKTFVIAGFQQGLSIVLGVFVLVMVFLPQQFAQRFQVTSVMFKPVAKLKSALGGLFAKKSYASLFSIGLLNGLLPCGLVYAAVAGAIAVADPLKAALFMAFFGLGTVPAMLGLSVAGQKISIGLRNNFRKISLVFVAVMGMLLIVRGMNLGIPYVSPVLDRHDCTKHQCCKK